jgi:hypothetical protein
MRSHHCCSEDLTCRWDQKGGQEDYRCFNKPVKHYKSQSYNNCPERESFSK